MAAPMNIARAGRRIVGGIVDLVFFFVFILVAGFVLGLTHPGEGGEGVAISNGPFLLVAFLCFLLFAFMEFKFGKTPGKFLTGMRVVADNGNKITFTQALIRNMARYIDGIALYLVGLIILLCTKENQRLGDLIAKTYVIKE